MKEWAQVLSVLMDPTPRDIRCYPGSIKYLTMTWVIGKLGEIIFLIKRDKNVRSKHDKEKDVRDK